jgi:hypothetical protein
MKKIMMTKYGFVRWPEQDFGDDGNRFTCYRVGERVRVSKCTYNGEAFIDASIDGTKLPYEVYSKLTHYSEISKLNGVSIESLTDQDMIDLYEACLAYEQEYIEAENNIQMPTLKEIEIQCKKVQTKRQLELIDINGAFSRSAVAIAGKLEKWEWTNLREYLLAIAAAVNSYDPDTYPQKIVGTSRSLDFCKPTCSELQDSFYYKWIMERLNK